MSPRLPIFINAACIVALPFLILLAGYFLFTEQLLPALIPLLAIVISMETRVRLGYRGKRGMLFGIHLAFGGFLGCALLLIFMRNAAPLFLAAEAAFIGMALTGALLVKGSWKRQVKLA